jgi:hypothetical protein
MLFLDSDLQLQDHRHREVDIRPTITEMKVMDEVAVEMIGLVGIVTRERVEIIGAVGMAEAVGNGAKEVVGLGVAVDIAAAVGIDLPPLGNALSLLFEDTHTPQSRTSVMVVMLFPTTPMLIYSVPLHTSLSYVSTDVRRAMKWCNEVYS